MSCKHRAVLIVTQQLDGTASSVAKARVELSCKLPADHDGDHRDTDGDESWADDGRLVTHVLRHEDET